MAGKLIWDIDRRWKNGMMNLMMRRLLSYITRLSERSDKGNEESKRRGETKWGKEQIKQLAKLGGKLVVM
ncbi:MAG: hypothetical protein WC686_05285 [Candidatus Shapirobacteria bacterium]|jgi:hypothetical protein